MVGKIDHYAKYINGWDGKLLLQKHSVEDYGFWKVLGEDPNCDMGGYHHRPELGIFEGKLRDVIQYVVTLPGWYAWGGGGKITAYKHKNIIKIDEKSLMEIERKRKDIESLEYDKSQIEKKIKALQEEIGE